MNSLEGFAVIVFILLVLYFVTSKMQENMVVLSPSNRYKSLDIKNNKNSNLKSCIGAYVTKKQKLNKLNKMNKRLELGEDSWLNWN